MPVPAGEPEAARVPEAGSAAATEERVANGACDTAASAIAAPTPGMPQHCATRAISMPVPASEPEATRVPEAGSTADTEERVANGACASAAPTPGTPDRQAIRATSLPAPAAEPGATIVPEGDSPTVAGEGATSSMRTIDAPSLGDQTGRAEKAARISREAPVAVPNGSGKRVANGTRVLDAPTPGTLDRQAIRATSLPAPAAKPGATTVPEGGSPTVAEEGVTGGLRASVAPSPGDPTGCANTAAPTLMTSPATDPDGSSAPTVTTEWLSVATRDAAILLIPVAHHPSVGLGVACHNTVPLGTGIDML